MPTSKNGARTRPARLVAREHELDLQRLVAHEHYLDLEGAELGHLGLPRLQSSSSSSRCVTATPDPSTNEGVTGGVRGRKKTKERDGQFGLNFPFFIYFIGLKSQQCHVITYRWVPLSEIVSIHA